MASLRHWIFSSGMTYSSTSFSGRPRAVPWRAVDGMASSRIAPRSVVSLGRRQTSLGVWSRCSCSFLTFSVIKATQFQLECVFWSPHRWIYRYKLHFWRCSFNQQLCKAETLCKVECSIYSEEWGRTEEAKWLLCMQIDAPAVGGEGGGAPACHLQSDHDPDILFYQGSGALNQKWHWISATFPSPTHLLHLNNSADEITTNHS